MHTGVNIFLENAPKVTLTLHTEWQIVT